MPDDLIEPCEGRWLSSNTDHSKVLIFPELTVQMLFFLYFWDRISPCKTRLASNLQRSVYLCIPSGLNAFATMLDTFSFHEGKYSRSPRQHLVETEWLFWDLKTSFVSQHILCRKKKRRRRNQTNKLKPQKAEWILKLILSEAVIFSHTSMAFSNWVTQYRKLRQKNYINMSINTPLLWKKRLEL